MSGVVDSRWTPLESQKVLTPIQISEWLFAYCHFAAPVHHFTQSDHISGTVAHCDFELARFVVSAKV